VGFGDWVTQCTSTTILKRTIHPSTLKSHHIFSGRAVPFSGLAPELAALFSVGDIQLLSTILVVDEDHLLADTLTEVINRFETEFLSFAAYDVQTALRLARQIRPDLVLLAAIMPDLRNPVNLEHAITIRDTYGCKVLLMSWYPLIGDLAKEAGVEPFEYIAEPAPPLAVIAKIRKVLSGSACPA
jgi:CheY-like chemotaxis protein